MTPKPPGAGPQPPESGLLPLDSLPRTANWWQRYAMLLTALLAAWLCVWATSLLTLQPWLGAGLAVHDANVVVERVHHGSPAEAAGLRVGMVLVALSSPDDPQGVALEPGDLVEDPELLPDYVAWERFYARQQRLSDLLAAPRPRLHVRDGREIVPRVLHVVPERERPIGTLPLAFWFQLTVATLSLLAVGWAVVVYPAQAATGFVALAGVVISISMLCAAGFSGRELALPRSLFHALSVAHHTAAMLSMLGLAGVLGCFPQRLRGASAWPMAGLFGVFLAWALANAMWWMPSPAWACHAMLVAAAALVIIQTGRQWHAARGQPQLRAAVAATGVPWVLAVCGVIGLQEGVLLLGGTPPIAQAWLYAASLATTAGVALALRHNRVFDIDDWGIQALLSWGAGLGTLAFYRLIVASQWLSADLAMLVAVLVFGVTYVPLSSSVWARSVLRHGPTPRELTGGILALGLAPPGERMRHWSTLLQQTLRARRLEITVAPAEVKDVRQPAVFAGGRALWVPSVAGLPGVTLWSRDGLLRRFSRGDRRLAQRLSELAALTVETRNAYVRGASDERERIADDLHDDLGAKLLSLVHASGHSGQQTTLLAREALEEMRLSVRNLKAQPLHTVHVLADWRAETVSRLTNAGIEADWDAHASSDALLMPMRTCAQMTRVLREAVSNVIRHAESACCHVRVHVTATDLRLEVEDNGHGLDPVAVAVAVGHGLPNIERRVRRLGGTHRFTSGARGGTLLTVHVPLELPGV
ncbi:MAG: ATP-binding protein [Pseudomonadota bacterium]|nr:ATP-binding protein [Pseudomonadota bacterium]